MERGLGIVNFIANWLGVFILRDMTTVQVHTEIALSDLLQGVEQLDNSTLERFADQVMLLRAQRRTLSLPKAEATLLRQINVGLSDDRQARFVELKEKRDKEVLTDLEHAELLTIIDEIEQNDVERMKAVTKLAQLRNLPVRELMQEFGLTATHD